MAEEAEAEAEPETEPELTPQEQAAKYPEVVQHITVRYNGKEKIFNTNCWAVNLYDALRQVARADAAETAKAALGDSKGMIETAKTALAELAVEGARGEEETEEDFNARVAAAEDAATAAEAEYADLKKQPSPSDVVDLADAQTGQLQGVNIRRKQLLANTFIKTRTVDILTRIESESATRRAHVCACALRFCWTCRNHLRVRGVIHAQKQRTRRQVRRQRSLRTYR